MGDESTDPYTPWPPLVGRGERGDATAIVSIAARQARPHGISDVLLVVALLAFGPLAVLDAKRLRHPVTMLHRAAQPGRAFPALGFVADTAVLGTPRGWRSFSPIFAHSALAGGRVVGAGRRAVCDRHGAPRARLARSRMRPHELTPDRWIVMGAPAIFALASATLDRGGLSSPIGVLGLVGWAMANFLDPRAGGRGAMACPDALAPSHPQALDHGLPARDVGASGQLGGQAFALAWMHAIGRGWLAVALTAWTAVAAGEIHFSFRPRH